MDIRLLGGVLRAAESIETLDQSKRRWILGSRDFGRTAEVLVAETNLPTESIATAYPAASALDGNRLSSMQSAGNAGTVRLTLDTKTTERKALLWLEYFEGEEIEPTELEFTTDAAGTWVSVFVDMVPLFRGDRYSLWQLPWEKSSHSITRTVIVGGELSFSVAPEETHNYIGYQVIPQSGPNRGMPRRVVSVYDDRGNTGYMMDTPWPAALSTGTAMLFKKFKSNYLENPLVRITLQNRYQQGTVPLRLVGLSLFNYYMELKGDKGQFRRYRAPNPTSVNRKSSGGVVTDLLDGNVSIEQRTGPKRTMQISWPAVYAGFFDWMETYMARGVIGLVDEDGRFMQGILTDLDADKLERAVGCGEEISLKTSFREI